MITSYYVTAPTASYRSQGRPSQLRCLFLVLSKQKNTLNMNHHNHLWEFSHSLIPMPSPVPVSHKQELMNDCNCSCCKQSEPGKTWEQGYSSSWAQGASHTTQAIIPSIALLHVAWCCSCSAIVTANFCSHVGHVHTFCMYWPREELAAASDSLCKLYTREYITLTILKPSMS